MLLSRLHEKLNLLKEERENLRAFFDCLCAEMSIHSNRPSLPRKNDNATKRDDYLEDLSEDEYPCAPNKKRR